VVASLAAVAGFTLVGGAVDAGATATPSAATPHVSGAQLTASTTSYNFGPITVGDIFAPLTITLTNTGTASDTVSGFIMGGADADDFVVDPIGFENPPQCTTVAAGASCTILVGFAPGALGLRSATIIPSDSSTTPPVITVEGTGTEGYYETTAQGAVYAHGDAQQVGDASGTPLVQPIVGMATTGDDAGYWLVASDGGVFTYGDATYYGSTGGIRLNKPIVGMAITADGGGYWLVASDGGIFTFGDAGFFGSTGGIHLNKPIVGMAATPDGGGYWLVASDGGIFTFGDAPFLGSTGGIHLNQPIVGMAPTPDGDGYWLMAADGGVFNFGDAPFDGSSAGAAGANFVSVATDAPATVQAITDSPALRHGGPGSHAVRRG